jgi:hypothetical protein
MAVIDRAPQKYIFARPKVGGSRRSRTDVALRSLPEFANFGWMVKNLAKDIYLSDNPARKRLPRGFVDKCDLGFALTNTADPLIMRTLSNEEIQLFDVNEFHDDVFTRSRDLLINLMAKSNKEDEIPKGFPINSVRLFKSLGKTLDGNEYIEFANPNNSSTGLFDIVIKKKILDKIIEKYTKKIEIEGIIYALDRHGNTFGIQSTSGELIHSKYSLKWEGLLIDAFNNLSELRVRIEAMAKLNRFDNILNFTDIQNMEVLSSSKSLPSINEQISSISTLKEGWMDGLGISFAPENLQFARRLIERLTAFHEIQSPYIYPALDGGVQAEWSQNNWETSLRFNFIEQLIEIHSIDIKTEMERLNVIKFGDNEVENKIVNFIRIIELHAGATA